MKIFEFPRAGFYLKGTAKPNHVKTKPNNPSANQNQTNHIQSKTKQTM